MKGGGGRRILGQPPNRRKDKDEDLLLFKELHKREKERIVSLLQPVSDEFDHNAAATYHPLYKIASGKKGSGFEFISQSEKNDYDWLKTPPATPLFPSLEMEANAAVPDLVLQREMPILQPLRRFAGNSEASQASNAKPKSPLNNNNPKPKVPPRSKTPSQRPSISSTAIEGKNSTKEAPTLSQKLTIQQYNVVTNTAKSTPQKETRTDFLASNLSKNTGMADSKTKPRSRGVSPSVRSSIPAQISGFSNQTPPNLRTDRSTSATRGRPASLATHHQNPEPVATKPIRRQSCSPSMTRGRKVESKQEMSGNNEGGKGRTQTGNNGTQVLGSRMVERMMKARKSVIEEKETKPKDSTGFGRLMSKSSLDMALKHMETKRDRTNFRHPSSAPGRSSN